MTKIAIISDIHANIDALNLVLKDIEKRGVDKIICLGDLVTKYFYPAEVVDAINEAFTNREFVQGTRNTYIGEFKNGMQIEMYIDNFTNKIISAFPIQ